jgi:proteasome component ECM29
MSTDASLEARELSLVSKVELRIALADTDEKLQRLLQTYLAPLLLKLASESHGVRSKVIAVCQHINTRIQPHSIQLPVTALLKQFKEQKSQLIRHFDLLYIQKGVDRLEPSARVELLPTVLQGPEAVASPQTPQER